MKKLFLLIVVLNFVFAGLAHAQEGASLLPSNPFYFLKEWRRGAQHFFTFSALKELELELQIVHEKAFEAKKLAEIDSENDKALEKAIASYLESLNRLRDSLSSLAGSGNNTKAEQFFNQLISKSLTHSEIFSGLKPNASDKNQKGLDQLQQSMGETLAIIPEKLGGDKKFRTNLEVVLNSRENGALSGIEAAGFLNWLEEALPINSIKEVYKLEEDILLAIQGQLLADASVLDNLAGDSDRLVVVLDGLREQVGDGADLKTKLNLLRQQALDQAPSKSARKLAGERTIAEAKRLISGLEGDFGKSFLLARAKFNLEQAEVSFASGQYNAAFGQATAAVAAIKSALSLVVRNQEDFESDIKNLKFQYDGLVKLAGDNSAVLELLAQAEKDLIKAADLLNDENPNLNKINSLVRGVKIILAEAEALIRQ